MNIFTQLKPEWHSKSPEELLELSPAVFKGMDDTQLNILESVLGIHNVREMVNHPEIEWVWQTFGLYRAGVQSDLPEEAPEHLVEEWQQRSCGEWLRSPLRSLKFLSGEASQQVREALGWATVRDMADDDAFEAAREIHRHVTGEPVPPEDTVQKPLPNYFEGTTNRYVNRKREEAGIAARAPAPPAPPPPPPGLEAHQPPQAPPGEADHGGVPPLEPRSFTAQLREETGAARSKSYSPEGAYIPKGGGSRGWFENQGVARNEQSNNYRYHQAVDSTGYRDVEVEHKVYVNLRGAERKEVRMQVRYTSGDSAPFPAICLDISLTGAKIRIGRKMAAGEVIWLTYVHRDELQGREQPLMRVEARVAWSRPVDPRFKAPRFDTGLEFQGVSIDKKERISKVMLGEWEELLAEGLPEEEETG